LRFEALNFKRIGMVMGNSFNEDGHRLENKDNGRDGVKVGFNTIDGLLRAKMPARNQAMLDKTWEPMSEEYTGQAVPVDQSLELVAQAGCGRIAALPGARPALRVALPSLALGGAERIVAEWLSDEAASGRRAQLAIAYKQGSETPLHPAVSVIRRPSWVAPAQFWGDVGAYWASLDARAPIGAHLMGLAEIQMLASCGLRLVPVLHNAREAWKGQPEHWREDYIACAMGCAPFVEREGKQVAPSLFWTALRHRPRLDPRVFDQATREEARRAARVAPHELMVVMLGSVKRQKNYPLAARVAALLDFKRPCKMVVAGAAGPAESDLPAMIAAVQEHGAQRSFRWLGARSDPWRLLAGADVFLNVSHHEGFSMALMEALGAGLPCVAPSLPGIIGMEGCSGLSLFPLGSSAEHIAGMLEHLPIRSELGALRALPSNRRFWSIPFGARAPGALVWGDGPAPKAGSVLFVTANLNAGGAQRSLCNLLVHGAGKALGAAALLCCDALPTHVLFLDMLTGARVPLASVGSNDPVVAAEEVARCATGLGASAVVFWNADAKLKLLVAKFLPPSVHIVDVSPGDYAFEELSEASAVSELADFSIDDYAERLALLVSKRPYGDRWRGAPAVFIPNGCPAPAARSAFEPPRHPRFVVCGRVAPSKQLELVFEGFGLFKSEHPTAELAVVGQAERRHEGWARALMDQHGQAQGVKWLGADPELSFQTQAWTAQITLGTRQGSPNAVLEALAAGIPVLANDDGGTAYALGVCGPGQDPAGVLLPEYPSAQDIAKAMRESLSDASQKAWRARAQVLCASVHSMDKMVECYARALAGLSGNPIVDKADA
jgi:glycosyltransferase involved in cell wall biosynthesis